MMAIMLGICIVGGAIFFALWDYWISELPPVVKPPPVEPPPQPPEESPGETLTVDLLFIESDDFITMAFNALPGEEGNNPTINMKVGDKVIFNVESSGISLHAFGVTQEIEGTDGIIPGTEIGTATQPMLNGESGISEFVPGEEGTYYYICTVPGHRAQGMEGMIVVGPADETDAAVSGPTGEAAPPTGVSHEFEFDFVESDDFRTFGFNGLEGDEGANPEIRVKSGDEITVTTVNTGISFHSFGVVVEPTDYTNVIWDSAIGSPVNPLKGGESGTTTFLAGAPGNYHYICTVPGHALQGMQGVLIVE